jgi:hypothetical protein
MIRPVSARVLLADLEKKESRISRPKEQHNLSITYRNNHASNNNKLRKR